ncbi:MAG: hypothetical protein Terrestrivirus1_197 [Terrestrivirus sp.]|uniref:Uncharacterized protein n=1 Tax=Terrestrivirus sp. TaxID=2487775 RepID=A0A3G4ZNZ2_9VIRU|nr:MAG: hypothetical protein Terrestrivirus1_197 [Terrestrivirus sp.]
MEEIYGFVIIIKFQIFNDVYKIELVNITNINYTINAKQINILFI